MDFLSIVLDFISQSLVMFGYILLEILSGKEYSECMKSKDEEGVTERAVIDTVIKRAPHIKSYEDYKSDIPDSFQDDIPKASIYKETLYSDLKGYGEVLESSKDITKKGSAGLATLVTAGASKSLGVTSSGIMGSILGGTFYSIGNAQLDVKKQEYLIQSEIQESAFSMGYEKLGEDRVRELAKIRCEENDLINGELNLNKINKASGDLYRDVVGKK